MLSGSKPSPATSATALVDDAKDDDAIDPETITSPLFAQWPSAEPTAGAANTRSGTALGGSKLVNGKWRFNESYVARKTNLMTSDNIMNVNCGDTKDCVPDAPELLKVTDSNPDHAVKVGDSMCGFTFP